MRRQPRPAPVPAGRLAWRGLNRRRTGWWTTARGWASGGEVRLDPRPAKPRGDAGDHH